MAIMGAASFIPRKTTILPEGSQPKKPHHQAFAQYSLQDGSIPGMRASRKASFFTSEGYCAAYAYTTIRPIS